MTAASVQIPVRPGLPPVVKGRCGAGVVPCDEPAQLYPCGWRCDDHSPAAACARAERSSS